jgi:ribonuclease HI
LHVLAKEARDVHIKTDSEYVLKGCLQHRFVWVALGWHKVSNADLWRQTHDLLRHRGGAVAISKVKGHATLRDVRCGRVSSRDKHGNDAADCLASAAAVANSLPESTVKDVLYRKRVVRDLQLMMVNIIVARSQRLNDNAAL